MEYTIQKLAVLAGVTTRTLRYYDQIGLLAPARISSSGYRIYGREEVDRLQQILFYREMDVPLDQIKELLSAPDYNRLTALRWHRESLRARANRLQELLKTVDKTIQAEERGMMMQDTEKFEGFKKRLIAENEESYGAEIREKYGEEVVEASNRKLMNLSQEDYQAMEEAGQEVLRLLDAAFDEGNPAGESGRKIAEAHKKWLGFTWTAYSPEAHKGLADMYVADERFAAYYDRGEAGKAVFLRDCIHAWLS